MISLQCRAITFPSFHRDGRHLSSSCFAPSPPTLLGSWLLLSVRICLPPPISWLLFCSLLYLHFGPLLQETPCGDEGLFTNTVVSGANPPPRPTRGSCLSFLRQNSAPLWVNTCSSPTHLLMGTRLLLGFAATSAQFGPLPRTCLGHPWGGQLSRTQPASMESSAASERPWLSCRLPCAWSSRLWSGWGQAGRLLSPAGAGQQGVQMRGPLVTVAGAGGRWGAQRHCAKPQGAYSQPPLVSHDFIPLLCHLKSVTEF